jgi:glyoxylase-like metal-dependent hydrolase (beta-lactamase superfamily II)
MRIKTNVMNGLMAQETAGMCPIPTQQLFNDLFVIRDDCVNVFLIKTKDGYIAIDAGIHAAAIKAECASLNIAPKEIRTVLLTHSDYDHVNGLDAFPQAQIYLPEKEQAMIGRFRISLSLKQMEEVSQRFAEYKPTTQAPLFATEEYWPEDDMAIKQTEQGVFISLAKNKLPCAYQLISDDQHLTLGGRKIRAVLINGHTPGLTAYLIDEMYLFVGDGLRLQNGKVRSFNTLLNLDQTQHIRSINKLKVLNNHYRYLFTQHYGYTGDVIGAFTEQVYEVA